MSRIKRIYSLRNLRLISGLTILKHGYELYIILPGARASHISTKFSVNGCFSSIDLNSICRIFSNASMLLGFTLVSLVLPSSAPTLYCLFTDDVCWLKETQNKFKTKQNHNNNKQTKQKAKTKQIKQHKKYFLSNCLVCTF